MTHIPANPERLTWARERAGLDTLALAGRFPKLTLPAPPQEPLLIHDFRFRQLARRA